MKWNIYINLVLVIIIDQLINMYPAETKAFNYQSMGI